MRFQTTQKYNSHDKTQKLFLFQKKFYPSIFWNFKLPKIGGKNQNFKKAALLDKNEIENLSKSYSNTPQLIIVNAVDLYPPDHGEVRP